MRDLDDETVMTAFLLESLEEGDTERVFTRLAEDEDFSERMQALEHELILRWHRGTLSPRERDLFARAYDTPARQARVAEGLALMRAFEAAPSAKAAGPALAASTVTESPRPLSNNPENEGVFASLGRWLTAPWSLPRWAAASAFALVILAAIAALNNGGFLGGERPPGAGGSGQGPVVAVTLRAVGEKGPTPARGFDTIYLPPDVSSIRLSVEPGVDPPPDAATLRAEVANQDRDDAVLTLGSPLVSQSRAGTALTFTVAPRDLPDGDYTLTIRRTAGADTSILSTQSFRVIRQQHRSR